VRYLSLRVIAMLRWVVMAAVVAIARRSNARIFAYFSDLRIALQPPRLGSLYV
jgi:hypothetical protein